MAVGNVGGWAMRFEGETYPLDFVEVVGPHRFRDLVSGDGAVEIGGLHWPDAGGVNTAHHILHEVGVIDQVVQFVRGHKVAVQAGGNVGVYPLRLAKDFEAVFTFEPDLDNYRCLERNIQGVGNIEAHCLALADRKGRSSLVHAPANCGAHYLDDGNRRDGHGVDLWTIDGLSLEACDLICLDVEGYEMAVLKGAASTITRFKPVILYEDKGMSDRYGVKQGEVEKWLAAEFGYRVAGRNRHDVLAVPT
jgi:FkbM family methyltransferase